MARRPPAAWTRLNREIVACNACPRLRRHCAEVARVKRRAFRDDDYWGRPVPGFGATDARVLLVGLAPAAHGANRTGRMFTGDRSGTWLYGSLHRVGLAVSPASTCRGDGQRLLGAFVTAACRCAPPANRPANDELQACSRWLDREIDLLGELRVVVALGGIAWNAVVARARRVDPRAVPRPRPRFGHGAETRLVLRRDDAPLPVLGTYHPSQQNTHTGRLTRAMLDGVLRTAARTAGIRRGRARSP